MPQTYEYFTFKENEDGQTVTLTDYNSSLSDSTDITIPATVDLVDGVWQEGTTYTVTAITDGGYNLGVFYDSGITSVTFPSSLKAIGSYAFQNCSGLTGELNLGECTNLTSIGSYAFDGCSALESVVFPEGSTGWYVTTSSTATSGTPVDVTNSSTNANNLTGQYYIYYWKRNG